METRRERSGVVVFRRRGDDAIQPHNTYMLTDERNWGSGLHGGGRLVHEGNHLRAGFAGSQDKSAPAEDGP